MDLPLRKAFNASVSEESWGTDNLPRLQHIAVHIRVR